MAFKMGGFNPGKGTGMGSAFYKKNEKDLKYRDPAEFSGPGEYAKHTGKWIGGKLKKSMKDLVGGVAALGGSMGKSKKKNKNTVNQQGVPGMGESAMKKVEDLKKRTQPKRYEGDPPKHKQNPNKKHRGEEGQEAGRNERMEFSTKGDEDRYYDLLEAGKHHRSYLGQKEKKDYEFIKSNKK